MTNKQYVKRNDGLVYLNERALKSEPIQEITTQRIWPEIRSSELKAMMDNYRAYELWYNTNLKNWNHEAEKYNNEVLGWVKEWNQVQAHVDDNSLFEAIYGALSVQDYNDLVEVQNQNNGRKSILKRLHVPLKNHHERTFNVLILLYRKQIAVQNELIKDHRYRVRSLEKVNATSHNFIENDFNGNRRMNLTTRTVRSHLYRLRDAGVILGYEYHGQNRPVNYYVNPEIFAVFDVKTKQIFGPENQLFTVCMRKSFPYTTGSTGTNINKKIIKENVDKSNSHQKGEKPTSLASRVNAVPAVRFLQGHQLSYEIPAQTAPKNSPGAGEKNDLSEHLRTLIDEENTLIFDLHTGKYHEYNQRDHLALFKKEAISGNMTKDEFRALLLQEFIRIFAGKWQDSEVNNWSQVVSMFNDFYLKTHNNQVPNKEVLMYYYENLIWRKNFVFRFLKKNKGFKLCTPSAYFNPFVDKEIKGFFRYTEKQLANYMDRKERYHERQQKTVASAAKIKVKNNTKDKIFKAIGRMDKNRISYKELVDYILNNIPNPKSHLDKLGEYIENYYLNYSKSA